VLASAPDSNGFDRTRHMLKISRQLEPYILPQGVRYCPINSQCRARSS
jgi:hypothetical protein